MKRVIIIIVVMLVICAAAFTILALRAGRRENLDNYPYEPDTPVPADHSGLFVSDHGTMEFNGDGEHVTIDFDEELAGLLGFSAGKHEATYDFLSGNLPPHGSFPVRYDIAHEMIITVDGQSATFDVGLVAEDGSTASVGVNMVTEERIPFLFRIEGKGYLNVIFTKQS